MSNGLRISQLPALQDDLADDDLLEVVDRSDVELTPSGRSYSVTFAELRRQCFGPIRMPARCLSPTAVTVNSALVVGANINGVTLALGDRVLLIAQADPGQNGLWQVGETTPFRPTDFAVGAAVAAVIVIVEAGTLGDSVWMSTADRGSDIVGTNALPFIRISGSLLASTTTNDSAVVGASVKDALETLDAGLTTLGGLISVLDGRVDTLESDVDALQSDMTAAYVILNNHEVRITALEGNVETLLDWYNASMSEPATYALSDLTDVAGTIIPLEGDTLIFTGGLWTPMSFQEAVDDRVSLLLQAGFGITLSYDDSGQALIISGISESGGGGVLPVVDTVALVFDADDASKRIRLDAGALSTAQTRVIQMPDMDVNLQPGATFAAASHTHAVTDIVEFDEAVDDRISALLVAGAGILLTYSDSENTLTITASGDDSGEAFAPLNFLPYANEYPTSNFAAFDVRNAHPLMSFDQGTTQSAIWSSIMPAAWDGTTPLSVAVTWCATTLATGNAVWTVALEWTRTDGGVNIDTDAWAVTPVQVIAAANGAFPVKTVFTLDAAARGNVIPGAMFRLRLQRLGAHVSNTLVGVAQVLGVVLTKV